MAELRTRSKELLDILKRDASEIALGTQVFAYPDDCLLSFQLDVPGVTYADVLQHLSKIMAVIENAAGPRIDPVSVTFASVIHAVADE